MDQGSAVERPPRAITRWSISSHTDDQLFEHLKTNVSLIPDPLRVILFLYHMNNVYDGTMDPGSVALDTGLSVDYDLATPVGLLSFFPLLFFHTDPRSDS